LGLAAVAAVSLDVCASFASLELAKSALVAQRVEFQISDPEHLKTMAWAGHVMKTLEPTQFVPVTKKAANLALKLLEEHHTFKVPPKGE
jgi:hypothetical protein